MNENGPPKLSFPTFLLKILAGLAGGVVGTVVLLAAFILSESLLAPLTAPEEGYTSPVFVFILMVIIFISSTLGNILSTFLLGLTEREKYTRRSTAIYQVFIISLIMFILMVPVYFITVATDLSLTAYAVALHIVLTAMISALILEIVSNYKYALVGVYGIAFSVLISAAVIFGLAGTIESPAILLFAALPVVWGSIAFTTGLVTMIYGGIARIYDKDFLSTQEVYGKDYGNEVEAPEPKKAKDESGANFLRHN